MSPAGECDCLRWFVTCRETEPSPAAWWPCPLAPPCRRLGVPLSGVCFGNQCSTAWGTTGSQWRPCPARGGIAVEARVRPGRRSRTRSEPVRPARPSPGRPRPPVRGPSLSVLGSRGTPRGGAQSRGGRSRALGWVSVLFTGLSWPHVLKYFEGS